MNEELASWHHIAEVERETGLGKDTLRVWERRYGFPLPQRDAQGERRYDDAQLARLRLVRRLLDRGHRPGRVVGLSMDALTELDAATLPVGAPRRPRRGTRSGNSAPAQLPPLDPSWLQLVQQHAIDELRRALHGKLLHHGLMATLEGVLAPLARAVGDAWASGELSVYQEHLFSEAAEGVLREAIAAADAPGRVPRRGPRVLLTTLAGEQHTLGLLMAEGVVALLGCERLALGPCTPLSEIAEAAQRLHADVVALGSSAHAPPRALRLDLQRLRERLPGPTALWVGGIGRATLGRKPPPGIQVVERIGMLATLIEDWRRAAG